jgi:Tfp pilus assembly protein PilW
MIAVFIGLLVVGGLFSLLYSLTQASGDQGDMATLQDNERVALMALQNVVETAGYLPQNYYFTTATSLPSISAALPAGGSYASVGQFLTGSDGGSNASDSIGVRYVSGSAASGADKVTDCVGHTYTTSSVNGYPFTTQFYVETSGSPAVTTLHCWVKDTATGSTGVDYPIASGLSTLNGPDPATGVDRSALQIKYGVDTNHSGTVNQYVTAGGMSGYWWNGTKSNVRSIVFTLNFMNPLYVSDTKTPGQKSVLPVSLTVFLLNSPT